MRVPVRRHFLPVLLAALFATASGCNSDTTTATTPTTGFTATDTFSGTVNHNGAQSFSFNILAAGTVTGTLTSLVDPLSPASSPTAGFSLGTWNGTSCAVDQGVFSDSAGTGAVIATGVTGSGTMCVRVYDPNSIIVNPLNFTVTVTHP